MVLYVEKIDLIPKQYILNLLYQKYLTLSTPCSVVVGSMTKIVSFPQFCLLMAKIAFQEIYHIKIFLEMQLLP